MMKRFKIAVLTAGIIVSVVACKVPERESGSDFTPDFECEYLCGDDWMDPIQKEK